MTFLAPNNAPHGNVTRRNILPISILRLSLGHTENTRHHCHCGLAGRRARQEIPRLGDHHPISSGFAFTLGRATVNLARADVSEEGSGECQAGDGDRRGPRPSSGAIVADHPASATEWLMRMGRTTGLPRWRGGQGRCA